jgi:hypothetical protein
MKSSPKVSFLRSIKALLRGPEITPNQAETAAANRAEIATHIDALMALPIKERSSVTVIGDEGVSGYNPPRPRRPDET